MVTRHQDRRCRCGTGVRDMYVHRKLPSAHSSMCVLKAALCVHAACVEVARGVYSTSLVVCGDVILARPWKKDDLSVFFKPDTSHVILSRQIIYTIHPQKQPTSSEHAADAERRTASSMHVQATTKRRNHDADMSHVLRLTRARRGPRDAHGRCALRRTAADRAAACHHTHASIRPESEVPLGPTKRAKGSTCNERICGCRHARCPSRRPSLVPCK